MNTGLHPLKFHILDLLHRRVIARNDEKYNVIFP